jgi:hypothetical protein
MSSRAADIDLLRKMLERFIHGEDFSINFAGNIGALFDEVYPEDERFVDTVLALASYQPGGGEFLYDQEEVTKMLRWALDEIDKEKEGAPGGSDASGR